MDQRSAYLAAYDEQLRGAAEIPNAVSTTRLGPLYLARFRSGRGFVGYRDLAGADAATIAGWVGEVVEHFADPPVNDLEWKTRGHDDAPGLHDALLAHGFVPEEQESVMVGEARLLTEAVELPAGVRLRAVTEEGDVRAASAVADRIFGDPVSTHRADSVLRSLAGGSQLWVAEADGEIVSTGRIEPVPGTEFAGLWGGVTVPQWRGRGVYRALTAARARAALDLGKRLLNSDSTQFSRPILERSGLVKVTTTTPYQRGAS
ncbi:GNAT family N-acetyltransferase [Nocardioides mangrovicus]|uniref:GNAT family N-acetyltransferase n=1 Tax=Nocardioides mangrovicus TaxID=2478913 RepID=A0A3L8NYX5_9ACTN|nr:GNAT family N-acetyltransferase [Nocardioides mangrovicus]RLV47773.1 GNAT family N-acetyltransferase [Nocardioides mangrovicus]